MSRIVIGIACVLMASLASAPAAAYSHANYHGGTTSHTEGSGSTTRTDAAGGSETHTYGQGTTATGRGGDQATHQEGSGQTTATNPYGGSATHTYGQGTSATSGVFAMGAIYAILPAGSISIPRNGTTYYLNSNTWFQPAFGANGV